MAVRRLSLPPARSCNLGVVLPLLLGVFMVADVVLRFLVPPAALSFRAWEGMVRFPANSGGFQANARYTTDHTFGDLTALANLPHERHYRPEVFTTDAWGFRNPTPLPGAPPVAAILLGTSMSGGSGVSDDQTLSAQLSALSGSAVYNAANASPCAQFVFEVAERLHVTHGLVVYEVLERGDVPQLTVLHGPVTCRGSKSLPPTDWRCTLSIWQHGVTHYSPLKILSERLFRMLLNDVVLPNSLERNVVRRRLLNGDEMLFLPADVAGGTHDASPDETAERLRSLAHALAARGLELVALLLPDKYAVYGRFGAAGRSDSGPAAPFLAELEERLRARDVSVVNLTPAFIDATAQLLPQHRYVYWTDDTHWNACGIAVAAREIWRMWRHDEGSAPAELPLTCTGEAGDSAAHAAAAGLPPDAAAAH